MVLLSRGVKLTSLSIWLPPGPLHSTWTTKVAPPRFLLRMVHRPNTESMSRAEYRTREYLPEREVERLMKAAGNNRHGHRDATMILMAFRHGLRASNCAR